MLLTWFVMAALATGLTGPAPGPEPIVFFVATDGNDAWSGHLAAPNAGRTDGPFATLARARDAIRGLKRGAQAPGVRVLMRGGRYELAEPLELGPEDSGTEAGPITYAAYEGEAPELSGGRKIAGWTDGLIHGRPCWVANVPEARDATWTFHELWVNGKRAIPARHPNAGEPLLRMEPAQDGAARVPRDRGQDQFRFAAGDMPQIGSSGNLTVVVLHYWVSERLAVAGLDRAGRVVRLAHPSRMHLMESGGPGSAQARYYLEDDIALIDAPGEWYLERASSRLYYLPRPGEARNTIDAIAPRLKSLLHLSGRPEAGRFVEHVNFEGLRFAHSEWWPARDNPVGEQASVSVPGAIAAEGARNCRFERCTVAHVGNYAIALGRGCTNNLVKHCHCFDLAGGGVKLGETAIRPEGPEGAQSNVVSDCHIEDGGRVFHQAVGVWIGQSPDNRIIRNHIHDLFYTGISVGWTWGYGRALATGNRIERNHIHNLGQGLLSDMGGIYTLGLHKGSVLAGNVIHDVAAYQYGGWGIYFDEGTTEIVAENNLVYRTTHGGFHQHYGRDNIVRNNIFAFGRDAQLQRTRVEPHRSFSFERNIVYWDHGALLAGNWSERKADFDHNLYWKVGASGSPDFSDRSWADWQRSGADVHSRIADPGFRAPKRDDFTLKADSPAFELGFKPLEVLSSDPP